MDRSPTIHLDRWRVTITSTSTFKGPHIISFKVPPHASEDTQVVDKSGEENVTEAEAEIKQEGTEEIETQSHFKEEESEVRSFHHSLSVGVDAKITHDFHVAREANPEAFTSRGNCFSWPSITTHMI